ncbi:hypothetical protein DPMN_081939 [Dreissena polymorpha]|uniref:Uncharacterized protein n=1 Tax=Dreissena polymorpha TaxID=45954 RepID=A0A9D3Y9K2_DREPO|nr:hypothetical protein DPMN_081904 [Dreissena polymorpha]KAH3694498.1 hypothetical protein DPMN_081938 [Dreissena polymorpha]KAH3694499.1 hypothetical protein DPMN_081939 [Dreissena polymorpha]
MENEADFPVCANTVKSIQPANIGQPPTPAQANLGYNIKETTLLLAEDIELNHGPRELEAMLAALRSSEANL